MAPTSIIKAPTIIVAASRNGIRSPLSDSKLTAIRGAHEPKRSPPLYANPLALFRIPVENLSDKNAGMGPNPEVAIIIRMTVKMILSRKVEALNRPYRTGTARIAEAAAKVAMALILPIFWLRYPAKMVPLRDVTVATIISDAISDFSNTM